jgi:hypothetical protein
MYCVIKCVKTKRVLKGNFASSVFHSCNAKTQKMQICVTGPQCIKVSNLKLRFLVLSPLQQMLGNFPTSSYTAVLCMLSNLRLPVGTPFVATST